MKLTLARVASAAFLAVLVATAACGSDRDLLIGVDCEQGFCDEQPTFTPAPDGGPVEASLSESTAMCPVTTCSLPWATCASSKFPCDVDLLRDDQNCGGCGIRCGDPEHPSDWSCVDGACTFSCGQQGTRDCDGDPSTGCEIDTTFDPNNCGDCGNECPDGVACHWGECDLGCAQDNTAPDSCDGECTHLHTDDRNCGACGNVCDPAGGPGAPALPSDMRYGCANGECGVKKCRVRTRADCNGDPSDGCETTLQTAENCNACNDACPAGKICGRVSGSLFACLCTDDREVYCGTTCVRVDDDPHNCGGCGQSCPGLLRPHFDSTCTFGVCGGACSEGYADCDGEPDNGCEVDTRVDNRNCGACGNACLPDQVCSRGECLMAPCDGPGDPTK